MAQTKTIALLGDIGGTNIRYELVEFDTTVQQVLKTLKKDTYLVSNYDIFEQSVINFLENQQYPTIAVIAMAGPIVDNSVSMANVPKWGNLVGESLGVSLKIKHFRFINDFEAASYGVLLVPKEDFISLNGLQANQNKLRGIIGPGTGLGNSTLYPAVVKKQKQIFVLASQAGHTDFPTIDQQTSQFFAFLLKETPYKYISLQRSFCGPAIPYMYKFYSNKYPEDADAKETPTSEVIISKAIEENPSRIVESVLKLFLKIYTAAMGNFLTHHMCSGGLYLVGSLTNSVLSKLKDIDFLSGFNSRHPETAHVVKTIPIIVCKQIDLGLKGAFFVARRIASD